MHGPGIVVLGIKEEEEKAGHKGWEMCVARRCCCERGRGKGEAGAIRANEDIVVSKERGKQECGRRVGVD
jgi:hypothetical protein